MAAKEKAEPTTENDHRNQFDKSEVAYQKITKQTFEQLANTKLEESATQYLNQLATT